MNLAFGVEILNMSQSHVGCWLIKLTVSGKQRPTDQVGNWLWRKHVGRDDQLIGVAQRFNRCPFTPASLQCNGGVLVGEQKT